MKTARILLAFALTGMGCDSKPEAAAPAQRAPAAPTAPAPAAPTTQPANTRPAALPVGEGRQQGVPELRQKEVRPMTAEERAQLAKFRQSPMERDLRHFDSDTRPAADW